MGNRLKIAIISLVIFTISNISFAEGTATNLSYKNTFQVNLVVPVLNALQSFVDVPLEFHHVLGRYGTFGIKAEFGGGMGVSVYAVQGGFALRTSGEGLRGFYLGGYGGATIAGGYGITIVAPMATVDLGYQWVINRFVINLGLGGSYVFGAINKFALSPALNLGFAF